MNAESLYLTGAPWIHLAREPDEPHPSRFRRFGKRDYLRVARGFRMMTYREFHNELSAVWQFIPGYGENYNALLDMLTDLPELCDDLGPEFRPYDSYIMVVTNAHKLLCDEDFDALRGFLEILTDAGEDLAQPTDYHDRFSRPGVPFHTVLEYPPEHFSAGVALVRRLMSKRPDAVEQLDD